VTWTSPIENADLLLQNRYRLQNHPIVQLSANPTWAEDPFGDANWKFLHHSLGSVQQLMQAYSLTQDARYRDKAVFLLKDWLADNPRSRPASVWAWSDHSTALRANTFACAAFYLPMEPWLHSGLALHGIALADPAFYVNEGNHALDQSMGLLEVGGTLRRADWMNLARDRIAVLLPKSVDEQGVTNEQSITYQGYNLRRYRLAEGRMKAWGLAVPPSFSRLNLMPNLLAHATRPDQRYEMLGDTPLGSAGSIKGTIAEYAATGGRSGPRPPGTTAVFRGGYLLARTSWAPTTQPYADQRMVSLRFGPAPILHGHADGGAVTLYGYGTSLLIDPGGYTYNPSVWRNYFKGRTAHNVVTVDGVTWNLRSHTTLTSHRHSDTMSYAEVYQPGNAGTSHVRTTVFSKRLGYVLVDDRLASTTVRTYRQLWHLPADGKPLVRSTFFNSQRGRGNVQVRQLVGGTTSRVVLGQTTPVQGWTSYLFGQKAPAPVVEVLKSGKTARYVTLLSTHAGAPATTVTGFQLTSDGYRATVTIGGKSERVVVSGGTATITPLN
jgi:hypothetical protein